jgi:hypothetical protein
VAPDRRRLMNWFAWTIIGILFLDAALIGIAVARLQDRVDELEKRRP